MAALLLYSQLAIAAYACPGWIPASPMAVEPAEAVAVELASVAGLPAFVEPAPAPPAHCEDSVGTTDPLFAKLCAEHCQYGKQNGQPPPLSVPVAWLMPMYDVTPIADDALPAHRTPTDPARRSASEPPHAIVHCCLRN